MLDALGTAVKEEEVVPGMQAEEEEEGEEGPEYDEHVWLSLKNAVALTNVLADNIQALDPDNKSDYMENAGKYVDELNDLDGRYELTVSKENVRQFCLATDSLSDIWRMIMALLTMLHLWDAVLSRRQVLRR